MIQRSNYGSTGQDISLSVLQSMWRDIKYSLTLSSFIIVNCTSICSRQENYQTAFSKDKNILTDRAKLSKKCVTCFYGRENSLWISNVHLFPHWSQYLGIWEKIWEKIWEIDTPELPNWQKILCYFFIDSGVNMNLLLTSKHLILS